jgi:antitoxin ParD1/3/4/toxin ParE1/3/4
VSRFLLTPQAELDLVGIWEYIARDSIRNADQVLDELERAMLALAANPGMGRLREEWADRRHRFWPVYSYIVMYRFETKPLQILRIVSGHRNLAELLRDPP